MSVGNVLNAYEKNASINISYSDKFDRTVSDMLLFIFTISRSHKDENKKVFF